jgi:hypothetical protein
VVLAVLVEAPRNKFPLSSGISRRAARLRTHSSVLVVHKFWVYRVKGVGSPSSGAQRALAALARDASLVREIGDLRSNRNPYDIIRAAQIPVAPKKGSPTRRQISVNTVLARADEHDFSASCCP